MHKIVITSLVSIGLSLGASAATIITQWNFNNGDGLNNTGTLVPSVGSGTAAAVGSLVGHDNFNAAGGSSDPLLTDPDNTAWRMLNFWPAQGTANKTAGIQLFISTGGWQNITLSWDQLNSTAASKYYRVQYSIDNGTNWVDKDVVTNASGGNGWQLPIATISFATVPGANNNTNFGVRIVSELESTVFQGGAAAYVGVNVAYNNTTANLRLDMMTFRGDAVTGNVDILADPSDVTVAVGQPASFTVSAGGGTTPITYQWRKAGSPIANATNTVLSFTSAQLTNSGTYDVIVTNGVNSRTSAVATLTVRTPLNLAWTGLNGSNWDTNTANWVDTGANNVAYTSGDNALFDSRGAGMPGVNLALSLNPTSVTVDSDSDYQFISSSGGKLLGTTGLTKRGNGTLMVDTDNNYSGPTLIQAGTIQLGNVDAHGALGSGTLSNNAALVVNRTGSFTLVNSLRGNGGVTNIGSGATTLSDVNNFTGRLSANAGSLIVAANQTISATDLYTTASTATGPGGATKFALGGGGLVVGVSTTIHFTGLNASPDNRATFQSLGGTNVINGPTILEGTGAGAFETAGVGTLLTINGNISGSGFSGTLFLRGANGSGIVNGTINLPGCSVLKPDTSVWTINSSNNVWSATTIAAGGFRLGAHNAMPIGLGLTFNGPSQTGFLDLAGFNQQFAAIGDTFAGTTFITNSSATADSTLTVGFGNYGGTIVDSSTGRKTSLTINSGTFTLSGSAPYSGATTVSAGTLALSGSGEIPNSATLNLAGGGLDVSAKNDQTLTISAAQTLKGNGTLAVNGGLVNNGTIELKVSKAGDVVTNDKLSVTGQLTSGGSLVLDLSGQALNWKDTIQVFLAGSYSGSVPVIVPAVPAPGASWDTTTLLTDGVLRVYGPPTVTSTVVSGSNLTLSGIGGVANSAFNLLTSTNATAPLNSWTTNQSGSFDANGNFSVITAISPGTPKRFFVLQVP